MSDLQTWPVPTLRELRGSRPDLVEALAWNKDGDPVQFRPSPEGHVYLGNLMRMNGKVRAATEGSWRLAPSRADIAQRLSGASESEG